MKETKYLLKPSIQLVPHSKNQIELRSGVWNYTTIMIEDEDGDGLLFEVLKELDGRLSNKEIAKKIGISQSKVESIIDNLQQYGLVAEHANNIVDYYLDSAHSVYQSQPNNSLKYKKIIIIGHNEMSKNFINQLQIIFKGVSIEYLDYCSKSLQILNNYSLESLNDGLEFERILNQFSEFSDCIVVYLEKTHNPHFCLKLNKILYNLGTPWIFSTIDGPFIFIGPAFAKDTPCFECLESRVYMNIRDNAVYQKYKMKLIENISFHNSSTISVILSNLLSAHLMLELVNLYTTNSTFIKEKILSIYLPTMEIKYHDLFKVPHCNTCGAQVQIANEPYFTLEALINEN